MSHQDLDSSESKELEDFLHERPVVSTKANLIENIVLKFGRISVSKIARFLKLKKDIIQFYLDTLEENGLIERRTTFVDQYVIATEKLIVLKRGDLISYIERNIGHFPAKKIKSHLHNFGWEMPLLDIILKNNADYIPMRITRMNKELGNA